MPANPLGPACEPDIERGFFKLLLLSRKLCEFRLGPLRHLAFVPDKRHTLLLHDLRRPGLKLGRLFVEQCTQFRAHDAVFGLTER